MGLVVSLILIAVGAILVWGVNAESTDFNVDAVGVILMIVGLVAFLLSLLMWRSWWGPGAFVAVPVALGLTERERLVRQPAHVRRRWWPARGSVLPKRPPRDARRGRGRRPTAGRPPASLGRRATRSRRSERSFQTDAGQSPSSS